MVLIRPCPRKAGIRYPCFFGGGGGGGGGLMAVVGLGDTPSFMLLLFVGGGVGSLAMMYLLRFFRMQADCKMK